MASLFDRWAMKKVNETHLWHAVAPGETVLKSMYPWRKDLLWMLLLMMMMVVVRMRMMQMRLTSTMPDDGWVCLFLVWQDHGNDPQRSLPRSIGVDLASTAHQVEATCARKQSGRRTAGQNIGLAIGERPLAMKVAEWKDLGKSRFNKMDILAVAYSLC